MDEYRMTKTKVTGEKAKNEYQQFIDDLVQTLQSMLGKDVCVSSRPVKQNNGISHMAVMIREADRNITPMIYPQKEFEEYQKNGDIEAAARQILLRHRKLAPDGSLDPESFTDIRRAGSRIVCRIISRQKNETLLEQVPHRDYLDLSVVYYWLSDDDADVNGAALIRNEYLELWGITPQELDRIAVENTRRLLPYQFVSMQDMIMSLTGGSFVDPEEREVPLYVLTNAEGCFGAVWITDPGVLEDIAGRLHQDYYVLPSSVHECVVLPCGPENDEMALQAMVREINSTQLRPEEVLADSVYRYSCRSKVLRVAAD